MTRVPPWPDLSQRPAHALLEIEHAGAQCRACSFTNVISGRWSVEEGRLVFRADADPLRTRGPDFASCGECGAEITGVQFDFDQEPLTAEEFQALQATERENQPTYE